jgi:hypothetical protein
MKNDSYPQAIICVANEGNDVSLQLWKIYKPLRDDDRLAGTHLHFTSTNGSPRIAS